MKWGLKEKLVVMSPVNVAVPADGKKVFEDKKKAMMDGAFTPFKGPVKDQSGAIRVVGGKTKPPEELMGFNGYVEGVEGSIPK